MQILTRQGYKVVAKLPITKDDSIADMRCTSDNKLLLVTKLGKVFIIRVTNKGKFIVKEITCKNI